MAYIYPLLDQEYNSTATLHSFSNAVFNYLDARYEPRGSQLLEPEKMKALFHFTSPAHLAEVCDRFRSLIYNEECLAFRIETVYTARGPSTTRAGLLTYLRAEIMRDPEEAFIGFNKATMQMGLGYPMVRAQFPRVAEPKTKVLSSHVHARLQKSLKEIAVRNTSAQEEQLEVLRTQAAIIAKSNQAVADLVSTNVVYRYR